MTRPTLTSRAAARSSYLATAARSATAIASLCLLLTACGGGGGDSSGSPASLPDAFPAQSAAAGDWAVYQRSITTSLPAGTPASTATTTREVASIAADGSFTRRDTFSDATLRNLLSANTQHQWTRITSANLDCTFAPGFPFAPAPGTLSGQTTSGSFTETCGNERLVIGYANEVDQRETKTVAAGSFDTLRYRAALSYTLNGRTTSYAETCWVERATGRTVACDSETRVNDTASGSPLNASQGRVELMAYASGGRSVGPAVQRFAGTWDMVYSGSQAGRCTWTIAASGQLAGSCTQGSGSFTMTGQVGSDGAVMLTASSGATVTGRLATPATGSGAWVNTGIQGSWTATHR